MVGNFKLFKKFYTLIYKQWTNDLGLISAGHRRSVPEICGVHSRGRTGHPWQGDGGHGQSVRVLLGVARPLEVQQIFADTVQGGRAGRSSRWRGRRRAGRQRRKSVGRHAKLPGPVRHRHRRLQWPPIRRPQWTRFVYNDLIIIIITIGGW